MASLGSLRRTLLYGLGGLLFAAAAVVALAAYFDVHHEIDELLDDHLAQSAALIAAQTAEELEEGEQIGFHEASRRPRRVAFQVWQGDELLTRSHNAPDTPLADQPGYSDVTYAGDRWRVFLLEGEYRTRVCVAEQHDVREELARSAALRSVVPLVLIAPLLAFAVWWLVRRALVPLERVGREVARRGPADLSPVGALSVPVEVAPLVTALDGLLERLGRSLEHERRLTADAAHELRTPIAAIRAQAQVAKASAADDERARALDGVIAGCDRASRLADQLLALSRLEAEDALRRETVDLRAIAVDVIADAAPRAIRAGVEIELVESAPVRAQADALLVGVLVRNLVDNALRHGAAGGRVRVSVRADGADAVIEVADAGRGVPPELLPRLGQRFQRASDASEPGSGLGLSIVQRIAVMHGGRVRYGAGLDGRGFRATVTLPAS
jgi:two-component system sensor histidine kinase QseC